ncbi:MAG: thioredoxin reductase [Hyphomicrobiales bacterium]|nr:MAG: thioredoxin reductase [Hyphomicrobiales bacterium]
MPYDAIIIGGSFAGLSAALYLARARRRVLVVDAGSPRNRYAKASHGFFGQDGRDPLAMIAEARAQLLVYPGVVFVQAEVTTVEHSLAHFAVSWEGGSETGTRLLLATGVVDQLPELPGLRERWGVSVLHCPYCHGFEFADAQIGVLGMGPLSLHQALMLSDWGPTTLFTDDRVPLDDEARAKLKARAVTVVEGKVSGLEGDGPALSGVALRDRGLVPVSALFIGAPVTMAAPFAAFLGCAFDDTPLGPIIRVGADKQTTVAGVYAAGDAARMPHSVAFAVADGAMAGIAMHQAGLAD